MALNRFLTTRPGFVGGVIRNRWKRFIPFFEKRAFGIVVFRITLVEFRLMEDATIRFEVIDERGFRGRERPEDLVI